MLCFPSCLITFSLEGPSLHLVILFLSSFITASNTLSFLPGISLNISKHSFNVKFSAFVTSSEISLVYVNKFIFTKFLWLHIWSFSNIGNINTPTGSYSILHLLVLYIGFKRHVWSYHFLFFFLHFVGNFFFQLSVFVTDESIFISGRQRGNTPPHFAVCELNNMCSDQSLTDLGRSDMIGQ